MKKLKNTLQSNKLYICLVIFIILYVIVFTKIIKYNTKLDNNNELIGIVTKLNVSNDKISFILKSQERIICNYYINKETENYDFNNLLGKKIKVFGKIGEIKNNTIPNTFNYEKYLYNNKIYNMFIVNNYEILENENIFYLLKNKIINKINSYENKIKTYLNLFIMGNNSFLEDDVYNNYHNNGIWHLFAVSGMHIGLIILILNKILKKIKFKKIIISLFLLYFSFLTSFSASILRATIFYYLSSLFNYYNIKINNKKLLILTAFLILIFNPFMIYNKGFQYSFLITYAIMSQSKNITGNYFNKILKISLISILVSLPITINLNYEFNILSIFLNLIYVPLISFIIFPLSFLTFLFPFLSEVLKFFILILEKSNSVFFIFKININIPKLSILFIINYYLLLILYNKYRNKKFLLFIIVLLIVNININKFDKNKYVGFFDVSQGDSSFIIDSYQKNVTLIDVGGLVNSDFHLSNNIILYFKSIGINKIDQLILTHGDYDHMGEAINLVNNFKVEKVIFNCGEFNELEQDLINVLDKKKIPYYSCIKELNAEDNKLYFLNNKDYGNENDNSSVIYTELNNYKFLFMGDAGVEVEQDLIEKYNLQNIDVLKVGHHGSRTSSSKEFIDKITPKCSIISVGKNNRYGHPNKEVLNNLDNSKIYRTDQDGSVIFKIKNDKL